MIGDSEWSISAFRSLDAKPALTDGEDAFHSFTVLYPEENEQGFGMVGPKFSATVIGNAAASGLGGSGGSSGSGTLASSSESAAAALAAGATLVATMLF